MSRKSSKIRGLIIPSDRIVPIANLKKQLLFFDQVIIPDPSDFSLVGHDEIQDSYPGGMTIVQMPRTPFPKEEDYDEKYKALIAKTQKLQRRGLIQIVSPSDWRAINPWFRIHVHEAVISNELLVKSAIPDVFDDKPVKIPDGVVHGLDIIKSGWERIPQIKIEKPYKIENIEYYWNTMAYLRLGRVTKYIRVAQIKNAAPIAFDESSSNILLALGQNAFQDLPKPDSLANLAIAMDIVNSQDLEKVLWELPWDDVLKIRKEILPKVADYRSAIIKKSKKIYRSHLISFSNYQQILEDDLNELNEAKKSLKKAWQGVGIVSAFKGLATAGAIGSASLIIPNDWQTLFATLLAGIAIGSGKITKELKEVLQTRESLIKHPLFIIEKQLPKIK